MNLTFPYSVLQITGREQKCDVRFLLKFLKISGFLNCFQELVGEKERKEEKFFLYCMSTRAYWDFESSHHPVRDEILRQPSLEQWIGAWKLGRSKKVMKSV